MFVRLNIYEGRLPMVMNAASVDVIGIPLNASPKKKVTSHQASAEKFTVSVNGFKDIEDDTDWDISQVLDAQQGWEKRLDQFFQMRKN